MRRYWVLLISIMVVSFAVLLWVGVRIRDGAPPVAGQVLTPDGKAVFEAGDIPAGQNVWQAMGGMEMGSVWGHGSYVAPDWTADWLHREATAILDLWAAADQGKPYQALDAPMRAGYRERLRAFMRGNTYDPQRRAIRVDPVRAEAIRTTSAHFMDVFAHGRADYAIPAGAQPDPVKLRQLSAFIFWTAWRPPRSARGRPSPTPTTGRTNPWWATPSPATPGSGPA
jgi:nitric oxide reductase subunit B